MDNDRLINEKLGKTNERKVKNEKNKVIRNTERNTVRKVENARQ